MSPATLNRDSGQHVLEELIGYIRGQLPNVVCFFNGKGGAGKTTCTSNCGATTASALVAVGSTKRVLCVELDGQGNMGLDLGYTRSSADDDGASILNVVMGTGSFNVIRDVRPQLDVIPGGQSILQIGRYLVTLRPAERRIAMLRFAKALADLAAVYEWIFIDLPPLDQSIQVLGLTAARWVVIPVSFDRASRFGLEGVSQAFEEAVELNPQLDVLGVLLFGFERKDVRLVRGTDDVFQETGQRARVRSRMAAVLDELGAEAPVFDTVISYARAVAETARETGKVAFEIANFAKDPAYKKSRRAQGLPALNEDSAEALAADYEELVEEIVLRAKEGNAA